MGSEWNKTFLDDLHSTFDGSNVILHAWDPTTKRTCNIEDIDEFNVREFISPTISPAYTSRTFYFGIRACFPDKPPTVWLSQGTTRSAMQQHNIRITLSNSSSSSGKIVTAGFILCKHPSMTHRIRYLQYLRSQLPTSCPYFDLVYFSKATDGDHNPHLAVRCGENHLLSLTEILSANLDGTAMAVFIGRLAFMDMGSETVKTIFSKHSQFISSLIRIPIIL